MVRTVWPSVRACVGGVRACFDGALIDEGLLLLAQHQNFADLCAHPTEAGPEPDHYRLRLRRRGTRRKSSRFRLEQINQYTEGWTS
jgi:hypothetical protein